METTNKKEKLSTWAKIDRQCRSFAQFAYNKETGEVMGRSNKSWAKIGLFYFAYYSFLTAFFSTCLTVFLSTINDPGKGGPKTIQFLVSDSSPGLTTLPEANDLKELNSHPNANRKSADKYVKGFGNAGYTGPVCSGDEKQELCKFNVTELGDCGKNPYGYGGNNFTCVFIKLNKVYGWKPQSNLGLSCEGVAGLEVLPKTGYYRDGFPFKGQSWYQTPPVAVKIPFPKSKVTIKCTLQGKGIKVSDVFKSSRAFGRVQFDVIP